MEYMVIKDRDLETEEILYAGYIEIEALRRYRDLKGRDGSMVKAIIERLDVMGVDFIDTYDVKEVIKENRIKMDRIIKGRF